MPLVIGGYYLSAQAVAWISTGVFAAAALSTPAGKQVLTNVTSTSLTKCEEKTCPPCNPPAGEKFNKVTHYGKHERDPDPLKGSHGCMAKTGSSIHWHYDVNNQNPKTCECNHAKHEFGGCGVAP